MAGKKRSRVYSRNGRLYTLPDCTSSADLPFAVGKGGKTMSLIDSYGLGGFVAQERMRGHTYREITKKINDNEMIPNGYKISHTAIANWCVNNGYGGTVHDDNDLQAINVYQRERKMLDVINTAMDTVSTQMDEMNKAVQNGTANVKDLKLLVDMLEKLSIRQQALSSDIGRMQEKVYNFEQVSKVFTVLRDVLQRELDIKVYATVLQAITSDPRLREAIQPIAPSGMV